VVLREGRKRKKRSDEIMMVSAGKREDKGKEGKKKKKKKREREREF
jgi:hypothetical protein